jgi:ABC-2 type transport system permease protein
MTTISTPLTNPRSLSRRSLLSELTALAAVFKREWTIFIRYPSWIFAMFIWPVIFPAGYILSGRALSGPDGSGLELFAKATGTHDFLGYIAVGTTIWMWQNVVLWNVGTSLREEQMRGTLESNWLSSTWRFSFLLGASLTHVLTMLIFLTISALEFGLLFGVRFHGNLLLLLLLLLVAMPSIYGLGFAFASLVINARESGSFVQLVRGLVMVFCGITFPISFLPGWMHAVAAWLPPTYMIHAIRSVVLTGADFPAIWPDIRMLLLFGAAWLVIGYVLFNWMERRARRTGAIGQY